MELYEEILLNALRNERTNVEITFPNLTIDAEKIVEAASYEALIKIKNILKDDSLNDEECFYKIEEIVRVLEKLGSSCGNRHDFG